MYSQAMHNGDIDQDECSLRDLLGNGISPSAAEIISPLLSNIPDADSQLHSLSNAAENGRFDGRLIISSNSDVKDDDSDDKDPFFVTSMPMKSMVICSRAWACRTYN